MVRPLQEIQSKEIELLNRSLMPSLWNVVEKKKRCGLRWALLGVLKVLISVAMVRVRCCFEKAVDVTVGRAWIVRLIDVEDRNVRAAVRQSIAVAASGVVICNGNSSRPPSEWRHK